MAVLLSGAAHALVSVPPSVSFIPYSRPEKMGCCFSKEMNPVPNERSSLLEPPACDSLCDGTEQRLRQTAVAVAQHVSLEEDDTRGSESQQDTSKQVYHKTDTNRASAAKDTPTRSGTGSDQSTIITTGPPETGTGQALTDGTLAHCTNTRLSENNPSSISPTSPNRKSPTRAEQSPKAALRPLWMTQQEQGYYPTAGGGQGSAAPGLVPDVVTSTLGQGFEKRTRGFYSICSIDAEDLEPDHGESQTAAPDDSQSHAWKCAASGAEKVHTSSVFVEKNEQETVKESEERRAAKTTVVHHEYSETVTGLHPPLEPNLTSTAPGVPPVDLVSAGLTPEEEHKAVFSDAQKTEGGVQVLLSENVGGAGCEPDTLTDKLTGKRESTGDISLDTKNEPEQTAEATVEHQGEDVCSLQIRHDTQRSHGSPQTSLHWELHDSFTQTDNHQNECKAEAILDRGSELITVQNLTEDIQSLGPDGESPSRISATPLSEHRSVCLSERNESEEQRGAADMVFTDADSFSQDRVTGNAPSLEPALEPQLLNPPLNAESFPESVAPIDKSTEGEQTHTRESDTSRLGLDNKTHHKHNTRSFQPVCAPQEQHFSSYFSAEPLSRIPVDRNLESEEPGKHGAGEKDGEEVQDRDVKQVCSVDSRLTETPLSLQQVCELESTDPSAPLSPDDASPPLEHQTLKSKRDSAEKSSDKSSGNTSQNSVCEDESEEFHTMKVSEEQTGDNEEDLKRFISVKSHRTEQCPPSSLSTSLCDINLSQPTDCRQLPTVQPRDTHSSCAKHSKEKNRREEDKTVRKMAEGDTLESKQEDSLAVKTEDNSEVPGPFTTLTPDDNDESARAAPHGMSLEQLSESPLHVGAETSVHRSTENPKEQWSESQTSKRSEERLKFCPVKSSEQHLESPLTEDRACIEHDAVSSLVLERDVSHQTPVAQHVDRPLDLRSPQVSAENSKEEQTSVESDRTESEVCSDSSGCSRDTFSAVDPAQIDVYASTPSYEIHCVPRDLSAVPLEEEDSESGMRDMVSELLGEDACSSICLYPQPWIRLGLEESCGGGWAQGTARVDGGGSGQDTELIPPSVAELQPSMALLGAFPFSTVNPEGGCVWDWSTACTPAVSV